MRKITLSVSNVIFSCLLGLVNGFFGGGAGMICVPLLENSFKIESKKAHATTIAIILPLSIGSSIIYIFSNEIKIISLLFVCVGVLIGGTIGAFLLKRLNSKFIKLIFAIVMLIAGIWIIV